VDQPGLSVVIPGARNGAQAHANAVAAELPPLDQAAHKTVQDVYDELIRPQIHDRW
jgi:aryl-alcohol dehydrogenase-like predicted oxidoreductase